MTPANRQPRSFLLSIVLFMAGVSVALVLAEGLVRVFAPHARDHVVPAGMFDIDPEFGWKLHALSETRHRTRYFDVRYSINSMGFRDKPRTVALSSGKRRILFFGDSQIFGWGVSREHGIAGIVEMRDTSTEVWNMAVPGYGLDQQILSYERDGRSLEASDVIFFATKNTFDRTLTSSRYRKAKPRFFVDSAGELVLVRIRQGSSAFTDLIYRALSPFYLPYFIEAQFSGLGQGRRWRSRDRTDPIAQPTMRLQLALLLKARDIATERNQRMVVLASLPATSAKELKEFCDRSGIVLVETPWPVPPPELVFGKYDGHWVPRAHELAAEQLLTRLNRAAATAASLESRPSSVPSNGATSALQLRADKPPR